jgi:PAS domain S-box-containing protein
MPASFEGPLWGIAAVSLLAGVAAAALAILAVGTLRRSVRRLADLLADLRRHPLVGDVPVDSDPSLRALSLELGHLLADLRGRVRELQGRSADLQGLADGPPDVALVALDPDWQVTSFSRGAANLTRWRADDILNRHVEALFAPGEWERILPKLARRSLRDAGIVETVRLLRRDGGTFPAQVSLAGGGDRAGTEGGMILAARDLTEEKELEGRLRESEERYRRLVEGLHDGVFIVQGHRLAYANPALARLMGVAPEALERLSFKDLIESRDLLRVLEVLRRAESGEEPSGTIDCRLRRQDGPPVQARLAWAAIEFRGGRAVIGTLADLTERARFERALAGSEARLQATLEATGDGILVLGFPPGGPEVALANRAFCELFGVTPQAILGLPEADLRRRLVARSSDPPALEAFLSGARPGAEGRLEGVEIAAPRRALVDLALGPVRSAAGEDLGVILTVREMTARADAERDLRQSVADLSKAKTDLEVAYRELAEAQKTLAQRNQQLESLNAELKSLDEMKSNLLANVSHELHTPLVSIKGYTEMILRRKLGPLTPEQERGLAVALKNIDRLVEMIDNLLSFSRMEKGETQLNLEDAPFWQMVDEAIDLVGERIKKKSIQVTTQYETDDLVVRGDRTKVLQVLTNLLTNAVKFNREGGQIRVTARRGPKGFIEVEVADTGIGIPPEAQDKIFERFYQVESSPNRRYEGTGIGLSIVRDILRLHGCSIRVASEPGQGSSFTFTLPLARDREPSPARPPAGRDRARE